MFVVAIHVPEFFIFHLTRPPFPWDQGQNRYKWTCRNHGTSCWCCCTHWKILRIFCDQTQVLLHDLAWSSPLYHTKCAVSNNPTVNLFYAKYQWYWGIDSTHIAFPFLLLNISHKTAANLPNNCKYSIWCKIEKAYTGSKLKVKYLIKLQNFLCFICMFLIKESKINMLNVLQNKYKILCSLILQNLSLDFIPMIV